MALTHMQLFVLSDCLKRLRQELLQPVSPDLSLEPDFLHSLENSLQPGKIERIWEKGLRGKKGLAERVEAGIVAVLGRVKVEPEVEEEMLRLKFVAAKAAFGSGSEDEDLTLSDTETAHSHSIISDILSAPSYVHPSFRVSPEKKSVPSAIANTPPTCPVPRHSETPLSLLYCAAGPKRHPKLENFRLKLIRGMMRSIREFAKGKHLYPKSGPHAIDICDPEQVQWYECLRAQFRANRAALVPCGRTQRGPDTKNRRQKGRSQRKSTRPASYNDSFCAKLLAAEPITAYFQTYLSVVFSDTDLQSLCTKLKVKCCAEAEHTQQCTEVWRQVQGFARWDMLARLGLNPPDLYFTSAPQLSPTPN